MHPKDRGTRRQLVQMPPPPSIDIASFNVEASIARILPGVEGLVPGIAVVNSGLEAGACGIAARNGGKIEHHARRRATPFFIRDGRSHEDEMISSK